MNFCINCSSKKNYKLGPRSDFWIRVPDILSIKHQILFHDQNLCLVYDNMISLYKNPLSSLRSDMVCVVLGILFDLFIFVLIQTAPWLEWSIRIKGICLFDFVSLSGRFSPPSPVWDPSYLSRWKSDQTFCPDEILPESIWSNYSSLLPPSLPCYPPWWRCRCCGCLSFWPPPSPWSTWP